MEVFTYSNSAELCENLARYSDTAILSFSCGKDSVAAWLQMRKYFKRIIPVYFYDVPHLSFVDEALEYYENFFDTHIYRFPQPAFIKRTLDGIYMNLEQHELALKMNEGIGFTKDYSKDMIIEAVRESMKVSDDTYHATGIRATDSPTRRMNIKKNGAVHHAQKLFYPVYDWKTEDIVREFDASGVKLPKDYEYIGCTFDGEGYKFLKGLKEHSPEDYERIIKWFGCGEVEVARYEGASAVNHYVRGE